MLEEQCGAARLRYSSIISEMAVERGLDPDDKPTLQGLFEKEGVVINTDNQNADTVFRDIVRLIESKKTAKELN